MKTGIDSTQNLVIYFVLAFVISWLIWSPGILSTLGFIELPLPFIIFFFMGTWGPFLASTLVIYRANGWGGVRDFLKQGFNHQFPKRWLIIMFLIVILVSGLPLAIHILLGGAPPAHTLLAQPLMIIPFFATYFFTGGGNEEWGWRGYALNQLQQRWTPLMSSILLGLIWGCWHIPLFFIEGTGQYHMSLVVFILATPGISILHTWIYNKTGKNLLAVWIFHAALGTAWEIFPIVQPQIQGYQRVYLLDFIAAAVVALLIRFVASSKLGYVQDTGYDLLK